MFLTTARTAGIPRRSDFIDDGAFITCLLLPGTPRGYMARAMISFMISLEPP